MRVGSISVILALKVLGITFSQLHTSLLKFHQWLMLIATLMSHWAIRVRLPLIVAILLVLML